MGIPPKCLGYLPGRQGLTLLFTMTMCLSLISSALAGDEAQFNTYSGDFWSRSTLTGDWGGVRNDLASKGVAFDASLTQVTQGIVGGGKDDLWKYGGRALLNTGRRFDRPAHQGPQLCHLECTCSLCQRTGRPGTGLLT